MITEARRRATDLTLPITFEIGDVRHVDFPDNTFDLCRTERVLRYLDRPEAALGEMARLARPGGSVLAFDFDSDQTVVDAPDPALTRRIAEVLDAAVPHPWIGRQLFGLFRRAGLRDVRVVPHVLCLSGGGRLVGSAEAGGRDGDILHGGSRIHSRRLQTVAKGRAGHGLLRDHRPWRDVSHGGSVTVAAGHVPRRPGR